MRVQIMEMPRGGHRVYFGDRAWPHHACSVYCERTEDAYIVYSQAQALLSHYDVLHLAYHLGIVRAHNESDLVVDDISDEVIREKTRGRILDQQAQEAREVMEWLAGYANNRGGEA